MEDQHQPTYFSRKGMWLGFIAYLLLACLIAILI